MLQQRTANRSDLTIILTGIGTRNAEKSIRTSIAKLQPRLVISSGFAGALDPTLAIGTVVFDCDDTLSLAEHLLLCGARKVRFFCSDQIVITSEAKASLRQSTGAESVEMESQIVRRVCRELGVPSATIRVISDAADEDLPLDFNLCMTPDCRMSYGKLLRLLAQSPFSVCRLLRFQRRVAHAAKKLTTALMALIESPSFAHPFSVPTGRIDNSPTL